MIIGIQHICLQCYIAYVFQSRPNVVEIRLKTRLYHDLREPDYYAIHEQRITEIALGLGHG